MNEITKEEKIYELKEIMRKAERVASAYDKNSDKNMALDYYGFFQAQKELKKLKGEK